MARRTTKKIRNMQLEDDSAALRIRFGQECGGEVRHFLCGIELAQAFGGFFGKRAVEIDFLDAVGLAALLDDRQDFDVPVVVARDRAPVFAAARPWFAACSGAVCTTRW